MGHTVRDCKGDRSNVVNLFPASQVALEPPHPIVRASQPCPGRPRRPHQSHGDRLASQGAPSIFEDDDFAAFSAELGYRGGS